jgi:hypothetical protein
MGLLLDFGNQYSPPPLFCSPHAEKVPFCYVLELLETADNADQSGEKETLDIGL